MRKRFPIARSAIRRLLIASGLPPLVLIAGAAQASETITYSYDAKGRLVKVERSGTVNNGVATTTSFDKADNRTGRTTTGV